MAKKTEATCVNRPIKSDMYQKTVQEVNFIRFQTSIVRIKSFKRVLNANIALGNKTKRHTERHFNKKNYKIESVCRY